MTPSPTNRKISSKPDHDGPAPATTEPISHATTVAKMMTTPPIVGVPRLVRCWVGPSWRMNCPYWCMTRKRMRIGVPVTDRAIAIINAAISPITGSFPSPAGCQPPATIANRKNP